MDVYFCWFGYPGAFVLSLLLVLLSLTLAVIFRTPDRYLCFTAMLLSWLGDMLLMNYRGIADKLPVPQFIAGAFVFALAHLIYASAFLYLIKKNHFSFTGIGMWVGIAVIMVTALVVTYLTFSGNSKNTMMYMVCIAYLAIIGLDLVTITSYSFSSGGTSYIAAFGILLFYLSDLIIGIGVLGIVSSHVLNALVWWLYPVGQLLIITHFKWLRKNNL